ncbi:MAG: amidohydrolase [Thermoguttaceae bacterium]
MSFFSRRFFLGGTVSLFSSLFLGKVTRGKQVDSVADSQNIADSRPVKILRESKESQLVPDIVFTGGKVLTVAPDFQVAQAFAILGDRILAVGSDTEIRGLVGSHTREVALDGKTIMPGIVDSHAHPISAAMYELDHEVPYMETIADVLAYFQSRTHVVPKGDWIALQQVFITRLREKRYPFRSELDSVAPEHPVFMRTGPDTMVNSLALSKLGIKKDSGDHAESGFGMIERDSATGEPTGMLRNCTALGTFLVPETERFGRDVQLQQLKKLLRKYNEVGITSIADRNAGDADLALYESLRDSGDLSCRIYAYHEVNSKLSADEIEKKVESIAQTPLAQKNNQLWVCGVKMFLDGGMLTGSARMRAPWGKSPIYRITDPEYLGLLFVPEEKLTRFVKASVQNNLQPSAHCVGDGALEVLLKAFQTVNDELPVQQVRPDICHGNFMYEEAIPRIRELGAVVDMQPGWLYLDGETLREHFGEERMRLFQPYRMLLDNKIAIGGGSDHMLKIDAEKAINFYDPFLGMWTMLTRLPRWTDRPLCPDERITREEAIRFYTFNSAYLMRVENEQGSLEPGKLADFIVLDRDVLECSLADFRQTKVLETWIGGKVGNGG